ncbi:MAG: hypothetical protein ACXVCP_06150 [Bdellovibrio sp.]
MKKIFVASVLAMMFLNAGCSMDVTLDQLSQPISKFLSKTRMTGLTSGSTQTGTASGGGVTYNVQTTVGSYMSDMEQSTNDGSYKVYSSVQGGLVTQ